MNTSDLWKECCRGDEHHKDESFKLLVSVLKKQMQEKEDLTGAKSEQFPKTGD